MLLSEVYLLNYNLQYYFNFYTNLKAPQNESTYGLFVDVVSLGSRVIHNATK